LLRLERGFAAFRAGKSSTKNTASPPQARAVGASLRGFLGPLAHVRSLAGSDRVRDRTANHNRTADHTIAG